MSLLSTLYRGGWLRTVDHALAESVRRLRPDTADVVLVAIALASRAVAHGHSRLPLEKVREFLLEINDELELPMLPVLELWLVLLHASPWVFVPSKSIGLGDGDANFSGTSFSDINFADTNFVDRYDSGDSVLVLEGNAIALRRYWAYENRLIQSMHSLMMTNDLADSGYDDSLITLDQRLTQFFQNPIDACQVNAARTILDKKFIILTGGPGTGKTRTIARSLILFAERFAKRSRLASQDLVGDSQKNFRDIQADQFPRIFLAAPTGKAAIRLAESVRENISQLIDQELIDPVWAQVISFEARTLHRLLGWQYGYAEFKHTRHYPLPADLIVIDEASMIDLPLMCKLFEAVAPNTTLVLVGDPDQLPSVDVGDVLSALCEVTDSSETTSSGNVISEKQVLLTQHRVHLTQVHRQASDIDITKLATMIRDNRADAVIEGLANKQFCGVQWQTGTDSNLAQSILEQALPSYRSVQLATSVESALAQAKRFRILTAVREGRAGSQEINSLIAHALDPLKHGNGFFPGRLILITENSYRQGLSNGDIGIAWRDETGELRVWFEGNSPDCLRSWLPSTLPAHESAFALTVHKSQGSEFDRIFLALPERGARTVSRELLYTGLTRCRQHAMLWASETALREGIQRRHRRWSGLVERLMVC